jgi:tetratricopeptide (TPR) repeat protein
MLCLWAYASYARRPSVGRYLVVMLALTMGLMSKPMLVTVPALLLLLDYWPLKRAESWKRLLLEKAPLLALAMGTAALTVVTQRMAGFVRTLDQFPLGFRISNTIVSYARYLGKTIWPVNLASYYPPPAHWPVGVVAGCALLLVLITILALATIRRARYLAVGWFWYLGTLVPVIGLVQVGRQAMADRYSYIPQIGLFMAAAWAAAAIAQRSTAAKQTVTAFASVALIALTIRAADQTRHWQDTETVATHALHVTENNNVAMVLVGNARRRADDVAGAEAMYRRALSVDPDYGMAHLNLGNILALRREYREAANHFEAALRWRPQLERAHLGLGVACSGLKDYDRADREFAEALRLAPRLAEAQQAWGASLKERGRLDDAAEHFRAALELNPQLAFARRQLMEITAVPVGAAPSTSSSTQPAPSDPTPPPAPGRP